MTAYQDFSSLYDAFMNDAPYEDWVDWLKRELPLSTFDVADVGCGTGRLTRMLAPHCRSVLGVDLSEDMLARAMELSLADHMVIPWLCQDMRTLHLPRPVHLAVSCCDCVNYVPSEDLKACFSAVYGNLVGDGWFCFDVLGPKRLNTLQDGLWYDLQDDAAVMFETSVDFHTGLIQYDVHAFQRETSDLYRRVHEQHEQHFHTIDELQETLKRCGFEVCEVMGDFGITEMDSSDRWAFICKRR